MRILHRCMYTYIHADIHTYNTRVWEKASRPVAMSEHESLQKDTIEWFKYLLKDSQKTVGQLAQRSGVPQPKIKAWLEGSLDPRSGLCMHTCVYICVCVCLCLVIRFFGP